MRPTVLAALAACLIVGVLVVRNGMIEAGYRANPAAMAAIGPSDARIRNQLAMVRLEQAKLQVSQTLLEDARSLLTVSPSSDVSLAVAGGALLQAGRVGEAIPRLEESRRRNPRNRFTRLFLLEAYLRSMKVPEAGTEIVVLGRLLGESRRVLVPVVARAMIDPVIGPQLESAVRSDPQLRSAVALAMVELNAQPAQVIGVGGSSPTQEPADKAWRAALLQKMVTAGKTADAYRLWRSFSGANRDGAHLSFLPLDGLPPFDWTYLATGDGVAEPTQHGALDVSFYNRNSVSVARKLVTLAPGTWRLDVAVEGGPTRGQEPLAATVTCAATSGALTRIPFTIARGGSMRAFAVFAVPDNCPGQWLAIDGTAQEFPTPRTVSVLSLALKRVK